MEKWAQHRTTDWADDDVAQRGSWVIEYPVMGDPDSKARWLAAGAKRVLRGIAAGTSEASDRAKSWARDALKELGL